MDENTIAALSIEERDKELQKLELEARVIQAQLEGCFRVLFNACTQVSLGNGFSYYKKLFAQADDLMLRMDAIVTRCEQIRQDIPPVLGQVESHKGRMN